MNVSTNFLNRLPTYYRIIEQFLNEGYEYISANDISKISSFNVEQVKKDLQIISTSEGIPKKGRKTKDLLNDLSEFLGYNSLNDSIIIGVGHLGTALLNFNGFEKLGINIIAGFDLNKEIIGTEINNRFIYNIDYLETFLKEHKTHIAILSTSNNSALEIAKRLQIAGIEAILNFTTAQIESNDKLIVENVNIAISLARLSHKLKEKDKSSL